jgi:phage shock protein C
MNDQWERTSRTSPDVEAGTSSDFQSAVERLEKAVDDLVGTAKDQLSDRATAFIDETTTRLEMEIGRRRGSGSIRSRGSTRTALQSGSQVSPVTARSRKLYRDPVRGKIGGVCAGIGAYYGAEPWVVRCIAVTGLLFLPSIVFPAYWIAYFLMEKLPQGNAEAGRCRRGQRHRQTHSSPSPELGARLSPRNSLRDVQADLAEAELRLRRMESHVTSGQFELHRELNRIDSGEKATPPQVS